MKATQKYIIKVLLTLLFFPIIISAQFPNYSKSYNYNQFLQGYTSGGGGVSVNINNNIFTLSFSAGFTETYLKQGIVASLDGYTTSLPNTEIPIPNGSFFDGKGYKFYLINNKICIYGNSPQRISSFSSSITISLTSPIPVSTKIVDYLNNYTGQNKTVSTEYLTSQGQSGNKKISIMYFDGLGRELESVAVGITPSGKDLIIPFEYDIYGRKAKEYLPIPTSQSGGLLVDINTAKNTSSSYYGEPAFAEKFYDNSPLNRVTLQGAPGNSWQIGSGHEVKFGYEVNTLTDNIKKHSVTTTLSGDIYNISFTNATSNYAAGLLTKKITKDEDWTSTDGNNRTTEEYTNKEGQTILVRKYINGTKVDTYYLYDIYGNLTYVTPPLASANATINQTILDNLCYQYKYDKRNRLVEKKLPGKGWEYMIYDKQNRLAATQDANLRAKSQWLFTKYDNLGRILYTGITTGSTTRATEQALVDAKTDNNEAKSTAVGFTSNGLGVYYTNSTAYPTSISTLLSVNYYDSYPVGMPTTANQIQGVNRLPLYSVPSNSVLTPKGLSTANFLKNIEDDSWTKLYNFYDEKNRIIATHSYNYLGGYTKTENKLNFIGLPTETYTYHKRLSTDTEIVIKERFEYDAQNRLLKHFHQINTNPEELLTNNEYNELGQLKNKKVGGNAGSPLQTVDYRYNVRGWMTGVNTNTDGTLQTSKLFNYSIFYNTLNPDFTRGTAKYNGNIAQVTWKTNYSDADDRTRNYSYEYDQLNRLINAKYDAKGTTNDQDYYNENLTYDLNGNITTLKRYSNPASGTTAQKIDDLVYNYENGGYSNKLNIITLPAGEVNNPSGYNVLQNAINYDANGNMINQFDKNISSISYNFLNLPKEITQTRGGNISYVYRADGVKIKKIYKRICLTCKPQPQPVNTDYLDGFQYEDTILQFVPTSEGYFDFTKNLYIYNYVDHLGNTRLSYTKNSAGVLEILEESNYYPFGLKHSGYNDITGATPSYKYKYNGKELQETGMYDYGARFYMPDIGRWGVVDPLAEQYRRWSPYNYAVNNPIRFIDPDGRGVDDWVKKDGKWSYTTEIKSLEAAKTQNYDDWAEDGHVLSNAKIGKDGEVGSVVLGADGKASYTTDSTVGALHQMAGCENLSQNEAYSSGQMSNLMSNVWNSSYVRSKIADSYSVGLSSNISLFVGTGTTPVNFTLLTRGKDPGLYFTPTVNALQVGSGIEANAGVSFSNGWYTGNPRDINSSMLQGKAYGGSVGLGLAVDASLNANYAPVDKMNPIKGGGFINAGGQIGVGIQGSPATGFNGQINYQFTPVVKPIFQFR